MNLAIYSWHYRPDLDTLMGEIAKPLACCNCFVEMPSRLFFFANVTNKTKAFCFSAPSVLTWRPAFAQADMSAFLQKSELPVELDKALSKKTRSTNLFATNDDFNFMYIGDVLLSFIGLDSNRSRIVRFHVKPKLSQEAWSLFGSYASWQLTINGQILGVSDVNDLQGILSSSWNQRCIDIWLTRYEEDQLHLVANGEFAFLRYVNEANGIALSSRNPRNQGRPGKIFTFAGFGDSDWDVDELTVVSKGEAFHLLTAFCQTGTPEGLFEIE